MSLAFLAKKSWHTTNLKNVERVWMAEQKGEEEKKKVIELQKQIAEERQIQELRQLQVASGHVIKIVDNTLDWMYEGPAAEKIQQQSTEEYLLGKTYKAKEESSSDLKKVGTNAAGATWSNKTSSKNDMFTRLHEDPMLLIKQNEKRNLENVLKNPLKMEKIRIAVAAQVDIREKESKELQKAAKKVAKKEKKDAKKEKKEAKDKKRARSSSSSRSPSRDNRASLPTSSDSNRHGDGTRYVERGTRERVDGGRLGDSHHDRSRSPNKRDGFSRDDRDNDRGRAERSQDDKYDDRRGGNSRYSDRGSERSGDHNRSSYGESRFSSSSSSSGRIRYRSRSRDQDSNSDRVDEIKKNEKEFSAGDDRTNTHRRESARNPIIGGAKDRDIKGDESRSKPTDKGENKKYGLQDRGSQSELKSSNGVNREHLGPSKTLLAKKEEEDNISRASKNKPRENIKKLTDNEREERIKQMESDANMNNDKRLQRIQSISTNKEDDKIELNSEASFLNSMRTEVYITNETTMKDRLQQNKHYMQKGSDLDSAGFMKK